MKKKKPVILFVDTGIDDAVGIALATKLDDIDIKLIVCEHGNTTIENSTNNTIGVLDIISAPNIPVIKGVHLENPRFIFNAHGENGLAGYTFEKSERKIIESPNVDFIYKTIKENSKVTLIELGPCTSLAETLKSHNDVKDYIEKIIIMGGSINEKLDTTKPYAEFNISSNPEAAEIVLSSGIDILMVPTEIGRKAFLDYYDIYKTKYSNLTGNFLEKLYRNYKHRAVKNGVATCDCTTVFASVYPEIFEIKPVYGFIKYFDTINSGVCLYDFNKKPNMSVCINIDIKKFKNLYFKTLRKLP